MNRQEVIDFLFPRLLPSIETVSVISHDEEETILFQAPKRPFVERFTTALGELRDFIVHPDAQARKDMVIGAVAASPFVVGSIIKILQPL